MKFTLCPACGEKKLNPVMVRNALSRYKSTYICSDCGTLEAVTGFFWRKAEDTVDRSSPD